MKSISFLDRNAILLRTDFLNKSLSLTSYDKITIKKVKLRLSLEDIISHSNDLDEQNILSKTSAFTIIYLLWSIFPVVKAFKNKTIKGKKSQSKEDLFIFTVEITNKTQIKNLLNDFFQEGNFLEKNLNIDKLDKITSKNKCFSYNTKINLGYFFQLVDFFNSNNNSYELDQIFISVNLIPQFTSNKQNWKLKDMFLYEFTG